MSINHITLMGVIVRGPEFRMTPSGVSMASFSIAVTRSPRQEGGQEVTDYVRITTWRNLAERVRDTLSKDDLVTIEGRLTTRSYETPDGQRRKTVEVEASQVEAVKAAGPGGHQPAEPPAAWDGPPDDDFRDLEVAAPPQAAPARRPAPAAPARPSAPPADLDDEIPF